MPANLVLVLGLTPEFDKRSLIRDFKHTQTYIFKFSRNKHRTRRCIIHISDIWPSGEFLGMIMCRCKELGVSRSWLSPLGIVPGASNYGHMGQLFMIGTCPDKES